METLYHADIFIPEWFEAPTERATLTYSRHALYAMNNDRYGAIPMFRTIPLSVFTLIELGVREDKVSKIVVRGRYDETRDVVFVLIPRDGDYFVKTVWFNLRTDSHKTLNRNRYAVA